MKVKDIQKQVEDQVKISSISSDEAVPYLEEAASFMQNLRLPGYHLHVAMTTEEGKTSFTIARLTHPSVGYTFVSPAEVGLADDKGEFILGGGDKVYIESGSTKGILLKIPTDIWQKRKNAETTEARSRLRAEADKRLDHKTPGE